MLGPRPFRQDPSRVNIIERSQDAEHEACVEDIQEDLMLKHVSIIAHRVFDDAEDGSDQNEYASGIEDEEVLFPGLWSCRG